MPYAPGVQNTAGASLQQGISTGLGRLLEYFGYLQKNAGETKELRTQLTTLEPDKKDQFSKMTKDELHGYLGATVMKSQQAGMALTTQLKQQQLTNAQAVGRGNTAMSNALQQASAPQTGTNPMAPGQPGAPGPSETGTTNGADPSALVKAMMANPDSVNSPAGRTALTQWMRQSGQRPDANGVVPWKMGDMGGGIETRTGKLFFDTDTEKKIAEARRSGAARSPTGATAEPANPKGPTLSEDKKFYWDGHLQAWKALPGQGNKGKTSLFDEGASASEQGSNPYKNQQDVVGDYKSGKLSWDEAAKILREDFGVK